MPVARYGAVEYSLDTHRHYTGSTMYCCTGVRMATCLFFVFLCFGLLCGNSERFLSHHLEYHLHIVAAVYLYFSTGLSCHCGSEWPPPCLGDVGDSINPAVSCAIEVVWYTCTWKYRGLHPCGSECGLHLIVSPRFGDLGDSINAAVSCV